MQKLRDVSAGNSSASAHTHSRDAERPNSTSALAGLRLSTTTYSAASAALRCCKRRQNLYFYAYLSPTSRRKTFVLFRREFRFGRKGEFFRTYQFGRLTLGSLVYFPLRFGYTTSADLHTGRHDVSSVRPHSGVANYAEK